MKSFIATIQLHAAGQPDYEKLHSEMKKEAFIIKRKISNPALHTILNAEQYKGKGKTLKEINDAVFRAVRRIGKQYSFTVMREVHA